MDKAIKISATGAILGIAAAPVCGFSGFAIAAMVLLCIAGICGLSFFLLIIWGA